MPERDGEASWLDYLGEEDRTFVKRFVLASGSLKEMAAIYRVSYPTVRLRLDRLIQKIGVVDEGRGARPFEILLRTRFAEGAIDTETFKTLLAAFRAEVGEDSR